jgi:hypothetical protein
MVRPQSSRCPLCGSDLHVKDVDIELPFRCAFCDKWLRAVHPRLYAGLGIAVALLISGFVCFEFGARGSNLLLASLLASGKCTLRRPNWNPVLRRQRTFWA